jgi:hypothetical protein
MSSDLTRVSLELGGKNAIAVLADANIDEILPTIPVGTEPVNETFLTSGDSIKYCPVSPLPVTTLITPRDCALEFFTDDWCLENWFSFNHWLYDCA